MRADRLLSILLLLQTNGRMTARELAAQLEVAPRTIHRDMEALSAAGVPIAAERGAGGGWYLPEGYRTNLTGLSSPEAQALFLSQPLRVLEDLGLEQASRGALTKLLAALPAGARRGAESMRQRILIDVTGWQRPGESVTFLPLLQDAVWQDRRVQLAYQRSDGTPSERLLDPLGLVAKGSVWYLVGAVDDEVRTYRVSRVQSAVVTAETFVRPANFDLGAYWAQSQAEFVTALPRHPVTVRAEAAIVGRLRQAGRWTRVEQVGPVGPDGWCEVSLRSDSEEAALEFVLGFGARLEVLSPPHLRQQVTEAARAMTHLYDRGNRTG